MKTIIFIFSVMFFVVQVSKSQIVYTSVNVTLSNSDTIYEVDINQDGIFDYKIILDTIRVEFDPLNKCYFIGISSYNNNYIASGYHPVKSSYDAVPLNENTVIDSSLLWETYPYYSTIALGYYCNGWFFGSFRGVFDKFIGLKFSDSVYTYYGWIRVDVAQWAEWITIKDFAFESSGGNIVSSITANVESEINSDNRISIYPNPARDFIDVKTKQNTVMNILNIEGQIINTINSNGKSKRLNIANLSNGIYFIKAITDKEMITTKFVKY